MPQDNIMAMIYLKFLCSTCISECNNIQNIVWKQTSNNTVSVSACDNNITN